MAYFAGLDVSVKETRVCIVDDAVDPLIAAGIAAWIIASTVREVFASSEELTRSGLCWGSP